MTWTKFPSEPGSKESIEKMFFQDVRKDLDKELKRGELPVDYHSISQQPKSIFNRDDDVLVSMPSRFISSNEPITEKNY